MWTFRLLVILCMAFGMASHALAGPEDSRLAITDTESTFELTVPLSRLILSVPKGGLTIGNNTRGGAANSPRYFYLNDKAGGVIVSGWFEPAERYKSLDDSWRQEMEKMQRSGWPAPQDVEHSDLGPWRSIVYHYVMPKGGTSAHVRATLIGAGTWIDLHTSVSGAGPSTETRPAAIALVRALKIREK